MKHTTLPFLFLSLLALSLVVAEDRTSDPNDLKFESPLTGIDSDGSWQVNLPHKDTLTGEDFNVDIKVEPLPQVENNFDDYQDPDADSIDDDDHPGLDQTADADFDLDLIRREIIGEAHKNVKKGRVEVQAIDDDDDDTDDYDYTNDARDETEPEKSVDSVDDDLRPDNGKISTQVSGNDYDDEVEDSDDGDDADIINSNDDSDDDEKIDLDYQQDDDSAMADDDYINDSNIQEVMDDNDDYTVDYNDDDSGDSDTDDDFLSKDYLKFVALDLANLNLTTIDIAADGSNSKADLNGIYYQADDDQDSDSGYDDDSDSDYDIYDTTYQEEPERGNLSSDDSQDSSYDYDIFLDIDDSVWASYLTDDDEAGNL